MECPMGWTIENNDSSGGKDLTDGKNSFPLSNQEIEVLKTGNRAALKEVVNTKRGSTGAAPTEADLDNIRSEIGGDPFKKAPKVKRTPKRSA
jgi:hypothetical protein